MNVYLYQNNTEKILKNAYIGEVYEYSYDFRNKTLAQIQADGFSVWEWTVKLNANWLASNSSSARVIVNKSLPSLSNAKRITISQTSIVNRTCAVRLNWTWRTYSTGIYLWAYQGIQMVSIANNNTQYSWLSAWTYTQTWVFDLANKVATLSCTWKSEQTKSITDTEISNIITYVNNIEIFVEFDTSYIQAINIVIEY